MIQKQKVPDDRTKHSAAPRDEHAPSHDAHAIRKGGIQPERGDPMKDHPLREPYARHSGEAPEESGTPGQVLRPGKGRRRRRFLADRSEP